MSSAENIKALEDAKKLLDTSAQANRNLFIAFNTVLITVLILCLSITDEILLIGSSTIKLPLLNVDLPIWAFATIAPLVLVALHFDLLQNLNAHRDKLITWCRYWFKVHPETLSNSPMPKQLYPFLFDFAWVYNNHVEPKSAGIRMLPRLCWLLYSWSTYTVLIIFFVRFADLQHYGYSTWHLALIIFDALLLHWYWAGFSTQAKPAAWQFVLAVVVAPITFLPWLGKKILNYLKTSRTKLTLLWFSNAVLAWSLILFTAIQLHIDFDSSPALVKKVLEWEETSYDYIGLRLIPRLSVPNFRVTLPDKFFELDELQFDIKKNQIWRDRPVITLNWSGRRLAFANFAFAQLPCIDLSGAKLQGTNFSNAILYKAILMSVNLNEANIGGANLLGAKLSFAKLQGAYLHKAALLETNLRYTNLRGANLSYAYLQGAYLFGTDLLGANISDANLQGAYLREVNLLGADIRGTHLQGADVKFSYLQGAVLIETQLKGVELDSEQLESSWQERIDWETDWNFSALKDFLEQQVYIIKYKLEEAEQRQKNFKPPQLAPPIDKEKFASIWLDLLCHDDYGTKGMLEQIRYTENHPVTKPQARDYLNQHEECKPYRALLAND